MYWTFDYKGKTYESWGKPRSIPEKEVKNLKPDYSVKIYSGEEIKPTDSVLMMMQGDSSLGLGDTIWLISFMRDIYRIKGRRKCNFCFSTNKIMQEFYSHFLPKSFYYSDEFIEKKIFDSFTHKLPAMYYWKEESVSDKSWVDNKSILERLYNWTGVKYEGLPDFGEFTDQNILYPDDTFYTKLGIKKGERYVFFQWHSSGHAKNLPPKSNIQLITHLVKKYGYKVYVIGRLDALKSLEKIPNVINLSNKTSGLDVFSLAFGADLIVCPDSAGIHLGEAYQIPTVGIMATLTPQYIASKYKIPSFMFGSGTCRYKPCGIVHELPRDRCPPETKEYCNVLTKIDLELFDKCVLETFSNRKRFRSKDPKNFYGALNEAITLED